ncbi:MAG: PqqD family protein, partial [Acidobacteria bacterium]|nr:PqqD family protein [Acidobacteriota bacterium]
RSRAAVVLNPTGSRIWERLDTPRTIADLSGDLCRRFPALSADEAARDVSAFLEELTRHDMVAIG